MKNYVDFMAYRLVPKRRNAKFESDVVYGPVISKRSFHSLGINLWPLGKVCSFRCVYCHCGKTPKPGELAVPLDRIKMEIKRGFEFHSGNNQFIQDILMEGNGEPTLYPYFKEVTDYVLKLRDIYFPNIPVVLFTNSTNLGKKEIADSVLRYNQAFFKLDCADDKTLKRVNDFSGLLADMIGNLKKVRDLIKTNEYTLKNFEISTAVVGSGEGNIKSIYSSRFSEMMKELNPQKIYLYDIDRIAPGAHHDYRISFDDLRLLGEHIFQDTCIETIMLYSGIGRGRHELSRLNAGCLSC